MTDGSRSFVLDISEHLFHLTTETVRLHSNETRRYQSLERLLIEILVEGRSPLDDHPAATIKDHLAAVPTIGDIRIRLRMPMPHRDILSELTEALAASLGSPLSVADTVSVLLLQYAAGKATDRIMARLKLDHVQEGQVGPQSAGDNVVPLKHLRPPDTGSAKD